MFRSTSFNVHDARFNNQLDLGEKDYMDIQERINASIRQSIRLTYELHNLHGEWLQPQFGFCNYLVPLEEIMSKSTLPCGGGYLKLIVTLQSIVVLTVGWVPLG